MVPNIPRYSHLVSGSAAGELDWGTRNEDVRGCCLRFHSQSSGLQNVRIFVAAGLNESQILPIRHRKRVDRKSRHQQLLRRRIHCPSRKCFALAIVRASRCPQESLPSAGRALDEDLRQGPHAEFFSRAANCEANKPSVSACIRRCSIATCSRVSISRRIRRDEPQRSIPQALVQFRAQLPVVFFDFRDGRPVARLVGGQPAADRVDSECEELVERAVACARKPQGSAQQVPVECFQMAQIENQPMAFRNRPFIKRIGRQQSNSASVARARFCNRASKEFSSLVTAREVAMRSPRRGGVPFYPSVGPASKLFCFRTIGCHKLSEGNSIKWAKEHTVISGRPYHDDCMYSSLRAIALRPSGQALRTRKPGHTRIRPHPAAPG